MAADLTSNLIDLNTDLALVCDRGAHATESESNNNGSAPDKQNGECLSPPNAAKDPFDMRKSRAESLI